jgi:hypothetical protein
MGLILNGYRNGFSPWRQGSGATISYLNGTAQNRNANLPGRLRNWNEYGDAQTAIPIGNLHPHAWLLPRTGGGMSMRVVGDGSLTASLIPSRAMSIDMTGAGDLDAIAALVISMACAMAGSGSLTATILAQLNMSVDMVGSGDLEADLSGIASMVVDMLGAGDLDATIAAYGNMEIDIVVTGTGLSTANVGSAVWKYLIESGYSAEQILRLIAAFAQGDATGLDGPTVEFKSIDGTKTRVEGDVSGGDRTITNRDAE